MVCPRLRAPGARAHTTADVVPRLYPAFGNKEATFKRAVARDGRWALELLRTEWAEEVVTQAGEHDRSRLRARTGQLELIAIARPILDGFVELVADSPVTVGRGRCS
jgi:hypothetical protein